MRIRPYREDYLSAIAHIQQLAAEIDKIHSDFDVVAWLTDTKQQREANTFVITDDDDDVNSWGQAGTLDGTQGEIVGYTTVQLLQDKRDYHFLSRGTVHPQYRRQHGGRILLVGAMNRARYLAQDFEFEAEEEGLGIYFEALLPAHDDASARLAAKCDMQPVSESVQDGLQLYRREL